MLVNIVEQDHSFSSKQLNRRTKISTVGSLQSDKMLHEMGYLACRPTNVPRLTVKIRKKQLAWAKGSQGMELRQDKSHLILPFDYVIQS